MTKIYQQRDCQGTEIVNNDIIHVLIWYVKWMTSLLDVYNEQSLGQESFLLCSDVGNIIKEMYGNDPPPIILVGHR